MKQINLKDYPARFALSGLPVIKVGIRYRQNYLICLLPATTAFRHNPTSD